MDTVAILPLPPMWTFGLFPGDLEAFDHFSRSLGSMIVILITSWSGLPLFPFSQYEFWVGFSPGFRNFWSLFWINWITNDRPDHFPIRVVGYICKKIKQTFMGSTLFDLTLQKVRSPRSKWQQFYPGFAERSRDHDLMIYGWWLWRRWSIHSPSIHYPTRSTHFRTFERRRWITSLLLLRDSDHWSPTLLQFYKLLFTSFSTENRFFTICRDFLPSNVIKFVLFSKNTLKSDHFDTFSSSSRLIRSPQIIYGWSLQKCFTTLRAVRWWSSPRLLITTITRLISPTTSTSIGCSTPSRPRAEPISWTLTSLANSGKWPWPRQQPHLAQCQKRRRWHPAALLL